MKKQSILLRLMAFTKKYSLYWTGALLCAVLSVSLTLLAPVIIGQGVDLIVGAGDVDFSGLLRVLVLLGAVILLGAGFQWLLALFTNLLTQRTVRDLRAAAFDKLDRAPLKYIDGNAHGDIISRVVTDIDLISEGLLQGFTQLFTGVITILGTLCFMLGVNAKIALAVVLITPLSLFVASFIAKRSHSLFSVQSAARGEMGGFVEEMIGNQKVVKAFGHESEAEKAFDGINQKLYQSGVKSQFYSSMTNPSTRFVNGLVYATVGVTGAFAAIRGVLTVGQVCLLYTSDAADD